MQKNSLQFMGMLVLLVITTIFNYAFFNTLGITGVTLLNLLVVVVAAYFCDFAIATLTAFLAFLSINYFFTEPRYTFEIAHLQSWVSLICFLIVSVVIATLVKQLQFQTFEAQLASQRAQFARTLAEKIALAADIDALLIETCQLLQSEFHKPFGVVLCNHAMNTETHYRFVKLADVPEPDPRLLKWVWENGKAISPYTEYWAKSAQWLLPFSRTANHEPILIVGDIGNDEPIETFNAIKSCVDQISQAYQRLNSSEKAKHAELIAQEEAIQSALLASISHDMRTPLTSILGAATTLLRTDLDHTQSKYLIALIASQARYLATATENILSLVRIESSAGKQIVMDWQSPEEMIGIALQQFQEQDASLEIEVHIRSPEALIKGNIHLLTQALCNLIDNAKHAHIGTEPIMIDVVKIDHFIHLTIQDRGAGFVELPDLAQIKKFGTTKSRGFGLGLAIVQAIATLHNAQFTIQHREGGGTCATLSFPTQILELPHAG
ncbi:MAG: DUF4118 domain-containing protein [Methylotenera sp.]|nr:DUF4118 domain-containing protein [Methylotenera sp.]